MDFYSKIKNLRFRNIYQVFKTWRGLPPVFPKVPHELGQMKAPCQNFVDMNFDGGSL